MSIPIRERSIIVCHSVGSVKIVRRPGWACSAPDTLYGLELRPLLRVYRCITLDAQFSGRSALFSQGLCHAETLSPLSRPRLPRRGDISVSRILGETGCNIVEVTQTILFGEFAAIFVVQATEGHSAEKLREQLAAGLAEAQVDLSVLVRPTIEGQWGRELNREPFVVTVDGPDKPGLIAVMSRVFARHGVNIESPKAILGEGGADHALFVFEVMVPESVNLDRHAPRADM